VLLDARRATATTANKVRSMRIPLRLAFIGVLFAATGMAVAGPLEDASAAYQRHDYATALRVWRPLADNGDVAAQTRLGYMFANGQGVPQTIPKP
jgi:hypothetical protein